jgi:hypothetical protein
MSISLHCAACGTETKANCNCGKPYRHMSAGEAAALAVAAHPNWSDRRIAEATGVSDFTIRHARKPTARNLAVEKREGLDGRKRRKPELEARQQRIAAKADAGVSAKEIAAAEGIAIRGVHKELEQARIDREAFERGVLHGRQNPDPAKVTLTKAQQKRLDNGERAYRQHLADIFEETVQKEIRRRVDEYVAPRFLEREKDAEQCRKFARRKGLFKREEYNVILRCVHPDRAPSIDEKNEAFRLLHENRLFLLSEKDDPRTYPPLPTADEFMAGIKRPFRKTEN